MSAIGIIETVGYANAVIAINEAGDAGHLELIYLDRQVGRFLVCAVLQGPIAEVRTALEIAESKLPQGKVKTSCIGNPHPALTKWLKTNSSLNLRR